jgi:DNA-binding NtrC family response regulator
VRELQNVIERAVILCTDGQDLQPDHLGFGNVPLAVPKTEAAGLPSNITPFKPAEPSTPEQILALHEVEKQHILKALEICDGHRTLAAEKLDISIRTLRNKLNEYGLGAKDNTPDANAG